MRTPLVSLVPMLLALSGSVCDPIVIDPPATPAPGGARALAVPFVAQQTPVWCWAAVSEMVFRYYGRGAAQCQVLTAWLGADCCRAPGLCLTGAPTLEVIQQSLAGFGGLRSTRAGGPLPFAAVMREIDAGRPMIAAYRGSFSGHVVVLYGYDANGGFVFIHDPFYGTFRVPYAQTFAYQGQLVWVDTLYGIG
jgi:hypothetical protein